MKWLSLALIAVVLLAACVAGAIASLKRKGGRGPQPKAKPPLTVREQPMFFRLQEAFPDHVVLAQVAFSALLTAKGTATRNTFDRKVADFVLCSRAFAVIAVIELDDSSHKGRATADANRQAILERAGYSVLRFRHVPDAADLRAAIDRLKQIPAPVMTKSPEASTS